MYISPLVLGLLGYTLVSTIAMVPLFIRWIGEGTFKSLLGIKDKKSSKFDLEDLYVIVFIPGFVVLTLLSLFGIGMLSLMSIIETKRR